MAFYDSQNGKIYVAQYDLSTFTKEITPSSERSIYDVTALGDSGFKGFPGVKGDKLRWSGLYDDGASGSDVIMDALRSATAGQVISVYPIGASNGNPVYASNLSWLTDAQIGTRIGNMVDYSANIEMGEARRCRSFEAEVTKTASYSTPSLDGSASSTDGGYWFYHVLAWSATGGNARWKLRFVDSADNSAFADLSPTSVPTITAVGAARVTIASGTTIRRYTRIEAQLDATSGSITFLASFERL